MAKSQMQRNREHVARIRRKAQAYDYLIKEMVNLNNFITHLPREEIINIVRPAVNGACAIEDGLTPGSWPYKSNTGSDK